MPVAERGLPFRTGTPMYDGYDDSSTLMSKEVALAFAKHYPEPGFNCSQVIDDPDPVAYKKYGWLSWGNSWIHNMCYWTQSLSTHLNLTISEPLLNCFYSAYKGDKKAHRVGDLPYNYSNPFDVKTSATFPCMATPLIFHHHQAALSLLSSPHIKHMCEYTLMADKVKDPAMMHSLWSNATFQNYHDYTPVFTHPHFQGWQIVLKNWSETEGAACNNRGKNGKNVEDAGSLQCQRLRYKRKLDSIKVRRYLYKSEQQQHDNENDPNEQDEGARDPGLLGYLDFFTIRG